MSHFLGFGFTTGYREIDRGQYDQRPTLDFPSGAAVIIRVDALWRLGLFDDEFFMYLEDADLGWKVRQAGLEVRFAPACRVYHKYQFTSPKRFYYYLERNRWLLLLTYYKAPTLLLLAPALALMELGQILFAARRRVLRQRLAVYGYFLRPGRLARLWRRRRVAQRRRCVSDRRFLAGHQGAIEFGPIRGPLVRYVANPLLGAYWRVVKSLIWW